MPLIIISHNNSIVIFIKSCMSSKIVGFQDWYNIIGAHTQYSHIYSVQKFFDFGLYFSRFGLNWYTLQDDFLSESFFST